MNLKEKRIICDVLEEILTQQYLSSSVLNVSTEDDANCSISKYNTLASRSRLLTKLMRDLGMGEEVIEVDRTACLKAEEQFNQINEKNIFILEKIKKLQEEFDWNRYKVMISDKATVSAIKDKLNRYVSLANKLGIDSIEIEKCKRYGIEQSDIRSEQDR